MEVKKLNRPCPLCHTQEGYCLHRISMKLPEEWSLSYGGGYDVVSCLGCGFTYADVDACQEDYNRYYAACNMYSQASDLKDQTTQMCNQLRMEIMLSYVKKDSTILDIGCGGGDFLAALKAHGYTELTGIDPSEASIHKIQETLDIKGYVGNIFDQPSLHLKERFDVVCCTMVAEHIYDLDSFLGQLKAYIKPETGRIFVDVPCVLGFETYLRNPANYFNHEHINYFSLLSLDRLFANSGLKRISTEKESIRTLEIEQKESVIEAIYGISDENSIFSRDEDSEKSICTYFDKIQKIQEKQLADIQNFIKNSEHEIAVWGTGSYCMQVLETIGDLSSKINYFIDSNETKWGTKIQKKSIFPPEELKKRKGKIRILILVMQQAEDVIKSIQNLNIDCEYWAG